MWVMVMGGGGVAHREWAERQEENGPQGTRHLQGALNGGLLTKGSTS